MLRNPKSVPFRRLEAVRHNRASDFRSLVLHDLCGVSIDIECDAHLRSPAAPKQS